jgi:hypothetical protein
VGLDDVRALRVARWRTNPDPSVGALLQLVGAEPPAAVALPLAAARRARFLIERHVLGEEVGKGG